MAEDGELQEALDLIAGIRAQGPSSDEIQQARDLIIELGNDRRKTMIYRGLQALMVSVAVSIPLLIAVVWAPEQVDKILPGVGVLAGAFLGRAITSKKN